MVRDAILSGRGDEILPPWRRQLRTQFYETEHDE